MSIGGTEVHDPVDAETWPSDLRSTGPGLPAWVPAGLAVLLAATLLAWVAWPLYGDRILSPGSDINIHRAAGLAVVLLAAVTVVAWKRPSLIAGFFTARDSAVNLAVFRIVLFLLLVTSENLAQARLYSRVPSELIVPPVGWGAALDVLPITPLIVDVAIGLFVVAGLLAMVGLYTRPAAFATVLLGIYVLGVPQFFGKVNHYHHLLWFALIIAVSRSGDALSVDAVRRGWREGVGRVRDPSRRDVAYGLPLRFGMLLIGILYFFPGFWKFVVSGLPWALSDNVKYKMYGKWVQFGDWTPFFRIDEYPLLYRASGVFTLLFELGFIFLLFHPTARRWAARAGVMFHASVLAFMRINFITVLALYVVFVDWARNLHRLGARVQSEMVHVRYDPGDRGQVRALGAVRALDVLGRVRYEPGKRGSALTASSGGMSARGDEAVRKLIRAVPLARLLPASRRRGLVEQASPSAGASRAGDWPASDAGGGGRSTGSVRAVALVGAILVMVSSFAGLTRLGQAWPVAVYPTFATLSGPEIASVTMEVETDDSSVHVLGGEDYGALLPPERLQGLIQSIMAETDSGRQQAQLLALLELTEDAMPELGEIRTVTFYRETVSVLPERRTDPPSEREVLLRESA